MNKAQKTAFESKKKLVAEVEERHSLRLWRRPLTTTFYFAAECGYQTALVFREILRYKVLACLSLLALIGFYSLRSVAGPHQAVIIYLEKSFLWYSWWCFLGFLSSCGFGSGLHTFVLYLGPFIAQVTMSAYICQSLDFPKPPYPDQIICPNTESVISDVSFYNIVRKVQTEAVFWGLGTAIGELPPYFMARTSRLSGRIQDEEIELSPTSSTTSSDVDSEFSPPKQIKPKPTLLQSAELLLQRLVTRAGFIGILLCASVPNPLFDLAGMTCGHFLVPFSTFFGATVIGKAIVKAHIQMFFVIAMSSEDHIDIMVRYLGKLPVIGEKLQKPLIEYLQHQKDKLLHKVVNTKTSWIQNVVSLIVTVAMLAFVISLVNAMAQNYHRRMCRHQHELTTTPMKSGKNSPNQTGTFKGLKQD